MSHHAAPLCDLCSINFKSLSLQRLLIVGIVILIGASHASDADGVAAENAAIGQKDRQQYLLRYRFKPGDRVRTKVVHQASVRTTI